MTLQEEITRRRTFAVIAHPDAGKTTLTEKLLLFGGAIHVAGAVKSNKIKKGATSDFMEIERQRGISVATAVMGFEYKGAKINILDTPGHEDFAEDTYRTLTAVDSVIIVIDGAKGVESQTRKLMEVCRMRSTPVIVFINKLDRPSKEPFDLLDEVEKELHIRVRPLAFPISNGPTFKGVYNLYERRLSLFTSDEKLTADASTVEIEDLASAELDERIGAKFADQLRQDVERAAEEIGFSDAPTEKSSMTLVGMGIFLGGLIFGWAFVTRIGNVPLSLTVSGGVLIAGLICGWLRAKRPTLGGVPEPAVWFMNNVGLNVFIAIVGITPGPSFVRGNQEVGWSLFLVGAVATTIPLVAGIFIGKYLFRFNEAIVLGCVSGSRTTTAALGAVEETLESNVPAMGYTITYAIGNTLLIIWGVVIVLLVA